MTYQFAKPLQLVVIISLLVPSASFAQLSSLPLSLPHLPRAQASCDLSAVPGVVWWGTERRMTIQKFAEYAAPVYWMSPDEPVMEDERGKAVRVPETLPFQQEPDAPMVYYQYNDVISRKIGDTEGLGDGPGYFADSTDKANSILDLHNIAAINLKYIAYFSREEGLGGHEHDVEPAEFRIVVLRSDAEWIVENYPEIQCDERNYVVLVTRVTAEAHGLVWFYNVLETDQYTRFPMFLLVEEGKHGLCTDKNSDGYYTPGFDVNVRVNDAWGVRDIIRGGTLFSGSFQAWMAKVRRPEHRVFPPLPEDSHLRDEHVEDGEYAPDNAIYELRPFPASTEAEGDPLLVHKMEEKEEVDWPDQSEIGTVKEFYKWSDAGLALKSFAISLRADGDLGFSFVFPLFILKNFEDPLTGGFIVNRMYLKDQGLRDFGWQLMYTPSASRWVDTYFAAGAEWDTEDVTADSTVSRTDFVLETGVKFRVNITKSPLKFLSFLTEFMGFRAGIINRGFFTIDRIGYVLEFGAGVW